MVRRRDPRCPWEQAQAVAVMANAFGLPDVKGGGFWQIG
jgi:hypothetical protein